MLHVCTWLHVKLASMHLHLYTLCNVGVCAVIEQLAQIFDCQLDASQIVLAYELIQNDVHPEALAAIIQEARSGQELGLSDEAPTIDARLGVQASK
jgi:hypothetical protein